MHPILKRYDDLVIASRDLTDAPGFTLTGLLHNEMHFLPPFLDHYRRLGVSRFIFIDDRSTDGTFEFLSEQNDVMVVKSKRKFGDQLPTNDAAALGLQHQRLVLVWRMLLLEKYSVGKWSLHLDADEFLDLPEGMLIGDFAAQLGEHEGAVWSVMIDMYPSTLTELADMESDTIIDLEKPWYFDGKTHLRLRRSKTPIKVYSGCRARLLTKFGLNGKATRFKMKMRRALGMQGANYNAIRKPVVLRWSAGHRFKSSHNVSLKASSQYLLPLRHYKFSGSIHERIRRAEHRSEYQDMARLFLAMSESDPDFRYAKSVCYTGFQDFRSTGNAVGFD